MSLTLVRFSYAGLSLSLQSDLEKLERPFRLQLERTNVELLMTLFLSLPDSYSHSGLFWSVSCNYGLENQSDPMLMFYTMDIKLSVRSELRDRAGC